MATPEEIEKLKKNWLADPCWDIEYTEGFEEHHDELLAYRMEQKAKWEARRREREEARAALVREQTGVLDADIVSAVYTWNEIEHDIERALENYELGNIYAALARATLLQAAQLKRIADALEDMEESDSLSDTVRIWGSGK